MDLIGIAESADRVASIVACARLHPGLTIGLMLRDPEHRADRVRELMKSATGGLPSNVRLIANGARVEGARLLHLTSAQLMSDDDGALRDMIEGITFGASAHSMAEAERAVKLGAGYITLSPIFPTSSKPGHAGIGVEMLRSIASSIAIPIYALGGMNDLSAIASAMSAGARGIASISLFSPGHEIARAEAFALFGG